MHIYPRYTKIYQYVQNTKRRWGRPARPGAGATVCFESNQEQWLKSIPSLAMFMIVGCSGHCFLKKSIERLWIIQKRSGKNKKKEFVPVRSGTVPYLSRPVTNPSLSPARLWSPCKQILWTMGEVSVGKRIPGLSLKKIPEEILQYSVGHWLSTMLVVPLIKDYVALMIVHAHGGFFIDMDIAPLGKVLPNEDFLFVEEPTKPEGHAFHRKALSLNFGFFKAPTGCGWLLELAQRIRKHWIGVVSKCMCGDRSTWPQFRGPWAQVAAVVMWNQKELTKAVGQNVDRSHVWKAIHFIPCNHSLKTWAPSKVLEQEIMDTSFTLNLWGSQWNSQLQVDALCFASALCLSRLSNSARVVSDMSSVELRLWLIDHHAMDDVQEVVSKRQRVAWCLKTKHMYSKDICRIFFFIEMYTNTGAIISTH